MKKLFALLLSFMLVTVVFVGCKKTTMPTDTGTTGTKFHIGVVGLSVSQAEDYVDAQKNLEKEYGTAANGGMIQSMTMPDNFSSEVETVIADIVGLADDPLMKAIVVCPGITGTAEAFKEIRAKRSDILLFASTTEEDPNVLDPAADLVVDTDQVSRGYLIVHTAKELGAKNFVFISFPRHMSIELTSRGWAIMQQTAKDLGITAHFQTAPDPTSDVGVAGAQQYILEHVPTWIQQYGKDTAFYTTNFALIEPLLKQIMKYGGIYTEPDVPSPLLGYPGAFGIDLKAEQGDWPAILKKEESTIVADGGSGRFGTWAYSANYACTVGLTQYAKNCIEGTMKVPDKQNLLSALDQNTPGSTWNCTNYTDLNTNKTSSNHFLVYQDTYVFGKGYMGTTKLVVPQKYLTLKASAQ